MLLRIATPILCLALLSCGTGAFNGNGLSASNPRLGPDGKPGTGDEGNGSEGSSSIPGLTTSTPTTKSCQEKSVGSINISMVFDRSSSLISNDPTGIRREAALTFLKQLTTFSAAHPEMEIKINTSSFCFSLYKDSDWISVKTADGASRAAAAIQASTSDTCLGTYYSDALKHAATRFAQLSTSVNKKSDRNYVLFFTDGLPLKVREGSKGILEKVANLTNNYGAAVIGIASGSEIPSKGENIVRSMALPATGIVSPNHTGLYIRAASPSDMKSSFLQAFEKVKGC